jgi:methylenetetrahydrofolate dehydrogenase (NADP+)/methenyltetrahydrofolate cyclohydrolase
MADMVKVRSATDVTVSLFDPTIPLRKTWEKRGAIIPIEREKLIQAYYNSSLDACLRNGTLVIDDKQFLYEIGFISESFHYDAVLTEAELLNVISALNYDDSVNGILVQLPLPEHINEVNIINAIRPDKDVDAFHPYNVGCLMAGEAEFLPCTPAGIMELLKRSNIEVAGKECVVVGRSNIVGKPIFHLLLQQNGTVTVCHSKTKNLKEVCKRADILICAIGKAKFFNEEYVKPGAVVIDVGINRDENGKLCGDVDFAAVEPIAGYITPVPGGCGPLTIAMLMKNTYSAACAQIGGASK